MIIPVVARQTLRRTVTVDGVRALQHICVLLQEVFEWMVCVQIVFVSARHFGQA